MISWVRCRNPADVAHLVPAARQRPVGQVTLGDRGHGPHGVPYVVGRALHHRRREPHADEQAAQGDAQHQVAFPGARADPVVQHRGQRVAQFRRRLSHRRADRGRVAVGVRGQTRDRVGRRLDRRKAGAVDGGLVDVSAEGRGRRVEGAGRGGQRRVLPQPGRRQQRPRQLHDLRVDQPGGAQAGVEGQVGGVGHAADLRRDRLGQGDPLRR
jgi:hypothetical protein